MTTIKLYNCSHKLIWTGELNGTESVEVPISMDDIKTISVSSQDDDIIRVHEAPDSRCGENNG